MPFIKYPHFCSISNSANNRYAMSFSNWLFIEWQKLRWSSLSSFLSDLILFFMPITSIIVEFHIISSGGTILCIPCMLSHSGKLVESKRLSITCFEISLIFYLCLYFILLPLSSTYQPEFEEMVILDPQFEVSNH